MVILISGASHTGKTMLSQKLLEKYKIPYLSIDHLKMGLIRSNYTKLTPYSNDDKLTEYLWPVIKEMIKTVIENNQNLIIEGCYIPFDFKKDFEDKYLEKIRFYCLIMSENYIKTNFCAIKKYADVMEKRIKDDLTLENTLIENARNFKLVNEYNLDYILIDKEFNVDIRL